MFARSPVAVLSYNKEFSSITFLMNYFLGGEAGPLPDSMVVPTSLMDRMTDTTENIIFQQTTCAEMNIRILLFDFLDRKNN